MPDHGAHDGKARVGERLSYIMQNHPNGVITAAQLAETSGVSERHIRDMKAGKANITLEVLEKITQALEINRPACLIDGEVFEQVKAQLRSLQEARALGVEGIRLRSHGTSPSDPGSGQTEALAAFLDKMVAIGNEAKQMQQGLPRQQALPPDLTP